MPYFTAALARRQATWEVTDVDLDSADTLEDLVSLFAAEAPDADPGLILIELEDEWFAVVRIQPDVGEVRTFVSNPAAAAESRYAEVLGLSEDGADSGDADLLADLGMPPEQLTRLAADESITPAEALAEIGEAAGFAGLVESLR